MGEQQPEELSTEELLDQIRKMKVSDLLLSTITTVAQLGFAKLDPSGRDLPQARLAIESLRALVPVLEGTAPEELLRDFNQVTANLQLAYAKAADEESGVSPGDGGGGEPEDKAETDDEPEDEVAPSGAGGS